jgi:hypothetical protein
MTLSLGCFSLAVSQCKPVTAPRDYRDPSRCPGTEAGHRLGQPFVTQGSTPGFCRLCPEKLPLKQPHLRTHFEAHPERASVPWRPRRELLPS